MGAVEIGTVRQETFDSGHSLWAYLPRYSPVWDDHKPRWVCIYSTHAGNIESDLAASDVEWLLENTSVIGAVPGTPAAAGLLAASAAQPAPFTDLTARLAAADAGWGLASGDGPSNPDYIRFLAQQLDAFEGHASPAAPADDEATVERVAKAIRAADLRAGASNVAYWTPERLDEEWATNCGPEWQEKHRVQARAALAALREGQQS